MITPVSSRLWNPRGNSLCHSIDDGIWNLEITLRCEAKASHKMKIKNMRAVNDSKEPIEDTTFHIIKASG
jgi:hypothetical protein